MMTQAWYGVVPTGAQAVVSIMADLYDPFGFWEPWKLQLKLMSQTLAGMEWDEHIRAEDQDLWKQQLS